METNIPEGWVPTEGIPTLELGMISSKKRQAADMHTLERNAAQPKHSGRLLSRPSAVLVYLNHKPCTGRALLDSGSLSDFVSTTLVDQLKLTYAVLDKPLPLQLAVSGSGSAVKAAARTQFRYQDISCGRTSDTVNIESYDVILGMPFLFQHKILLGFNPSEVKVRSVNLLPIRGAQTLVLQARATEAHFDELELCCAELRKCSEDVCKEAIETPPPLREINHVIPVIDLNQVYT
ncbi:hypothetical protein HYDPIDRAFT_34401 [Hydnomerulius pinastri MD-312]|uniref:Uncharacterized protein n=1 Tax=Hydnomerulius pinastri MD-312 TaxID=994086 RepID=A0A0C9VKY5_9AGAM|nr:hypothetical protein HYDPIDRAFT_34401 [Hydnomerulius pinastri MD-312]